MILEEVMADLGYEDEYFKPQLKPVIDAAIVELNIVGVRQICECDQYSFEEYITNQGLRSLARNYIDIYTRLQFDPPQNSKQIEAFENNLKRLRSRIKDLSECF